MSSRTALFIVSFCLAHSIQAFDFKIGNLVFVTNEQGSSVSVMAEGVPFREENLSLFDSVVIPSSVTYSGTTYPVTSIGSSAFQYCYDLSSVTIPEGVTTIGSKAFGNCHSLKEIVILFSFPKGKSDRYVIPDGIV